RQIVMAGIAVVLGQLRPRATLVRARGAVREKLEGRLRRSELAVLPDLGLVIRLTPGNDPSAPVPWYIGQENTQLEVEARMTGGNQVVVHVANRDLHSLCRGADMAAGT